MNSIPGIIDSVIKDDLFAQINIVYREFMFSACILLSEDDMPYGKIGTPVSMNFKECDTFIALDSSCCVSCRNRFIAKVTNIISSPVITRVTADFNGIPIISMITSDSARFLNLEKGVNVVCIVKSTSMMLYSGVTNDR